MKKIKNKKIIFAVFLFTILPLLIFAGTSGIENHGLGGDLNTAIKTMISGLLKLALPFLVLAYVYVGFLFTKAQGSADKLQEARKALIWVIVGTVIIIGANAIYSVIEDTLSQANIAKNLLENKINLG